MRLEKAELIMVEFVSDWGHEEDDLRNDRAVTGRVPC